MLITYFEQIEQRCADRKVNISDALYKAGINKSTFYRWKIGETSPQEGTTRQIMRAIDELAA